VRQDNAAAIRLYERRGYRRIGAYAAFYEDGADAWRYQKDLRPKT
jgi:[ribosomal protein S18]-alanine N-acetyltransferase